MTALGLLAIYGCHPARRDACPLTLDADTVGVRVTHCTRRTAAGDEVGLQPLHAANRRLVGDTSPIRQ